MIKPLRTYHFFLWVMLALTIPVAFLFALIDRPDYSADKQNSSTLPFTFSVNDADSLINIVVHVTQPLTAPSCVLFAGTENDKVLLGKLHQQGSYQFQLSKRHMSGDELTLLLVDAIHHKEIARHVIEVQTRKEAIQSKKSKIRN